MTYEHIIGTEEMIKNIAKLQEKMGAECFMEWANSLPVKILLDNRLYHHEIKRELYRREPAAFFDAALFVQ